MDSDNLWKKQVSEKNGKVYFVNTITSEIFETSVYETDSYIKIQTIDGQVQIPEDALIVLRQWSDTFDAFSRWKQNTIPNVNVSSSYLTRLISIARASFQYESLDSSLIPLDLYDELNDPPLLKFQIRKQIYYMFNLHTKDKFTELYDEEIGITDQMKEFFNELTGYNCFCENILDVRNNYENYDDYAYSFSGNATEFPRDKLRTLYMLVSEKDKVSFEMFCNEKREEVIQSIKSSLPPGWRIVKSKKSDNKSFYYNTVTKVSQWDWPEPHKVMEELKRLWNILKTSTNEHDKNYVSVLEGRLDTREKERKDRYEIYIIRELKSLWKNLDEDEKLTWCLDEMVSVGIPIDVLN